jgi:transcriptional regulator with XRE-family HTH domain
VPSEETGLAATLIAQIGAKSGLNQAELARRAGLDRSVLSAYAHGRRQPSVAALGRIARGAGLELELVPAANDAAAEHAGRVLSMVLDLAGSLPFKGRGELQYPPLIRLRDTSPLDGFR